MADAPHTPAVARSAPLPRLIGAAVGLALFAAAIYAVATRGDALAAGLDALASAHPARVALVLLLPALNLVLVSLSFQVLTARYARVGTTEMGALIASAWLLNFLPMRPGLVGRVAYHKKVHGMRVRDSARIVVWGIVLSGTGQLVLLAIAALTVARADATTLAIAMSVPAIAAGAVVALLRRREGHAWRLAAAWLLRYLDLLVWTWRYAALAALLGTPITLSTAVAMCLAAQLAQLIPISGNGLGLREWGIALLAASLGALSREQGIAIDLVNRGSEILVAVPLGLLGARFLLRRRRRGPRESDTLQSAPDPADASERITG